MSRLSWIDDDQLEKIVSEMLSRAEKAKDKAHKRIKTNVIDPFASLVTSAVVNINNKDQLSRALQDTSAISATSNAVGNFHQEILGAIEGFRNHDAGYDLECAEKKILAEVKNKHNTMNSSNRENVINKLATAISQKPSRDWAAYLVIIIPKKPEPYKKPIPGKRNVYEIDGVSFYKLATGSPTALHDLYRAVEKIIIERYPLINSKDATALGYCQEALAEAFGTE
ncbi:MAG: Eco47II family restriction endonuclease [Gammaproteobacteria bacterium AqS3]|nr:Eco47II family restriction endonuclease [Gammaproteobacteria bacterium AqS3]